MIMKKTPKQKQRDYYVKIASQIQAMFDDDCENHIDIQEFEDGENLKSFLHVLSTQVPNMLYNKISEDKVDSLRFNHIANMLVFEYCSTDEDQPA